jgi:rod shape-determining protein MreC
VITSGGDQIYPRGLAVGVVDEVVADPEREPYVDIVIKPAANLSHLEEVLVVTGTSDTLPPKAQRDMERSQAVGAVEAEKQRASDVLAERLPGIDDPNATPEEQQAEQDAAAKPAGEEPGRPIKPLTPLHPDRFSPGSVPTAAQMIPGRIPVVVSAARSAQLAQAGAVATPKPRPHTATADGAGDAKDHGSSAAVKATAAKPAVTGADEAKPGVAKPEGERPVAKSAPKPAASGEETHGATSEPRSQPRSEHPDVPTTVVTDGPIVKPPVPYVEPKTVVRKPATEPPATEPPASREPQN